MPSEAKKKVLESGEYLDEILFVKALSLCALRSKAFEKESTSVEKILHFIEKIMQSTGIAKVKKLVGKTRISGVDIDPLVELRKLYSEYFGDSPAGNDPNKLLNQVFAEDS